VARIRIEYWEKWGGEEWEAMAGIVRSFNEAQHGYEVVMMPAGDWSSSPDLPRFLTAQQQGTPPDLIGLEDHQIVDLAVQGALTPLEETATPAELLTMDYDQPFLGLGMHNGELYGVPVSADIVTLYVNLASVQGTPFEAGRIPADLSEFDAGLEQLRKQRKIGLVPTYPGWWPQAWPLFFGGFWFDSEGKFTPDNPANVQAYDWVSSFRKRWDLDAFHALFNPIGARKPDPFLVGKVAMVFEGDWLVRRLLRVPDLEWMPAAFPTVSQKPAALIVADILSIPKGAQHPEGAAAFLHYAMQPKEIERLALGHSKISPLRTWSRSFLAQHQNAKLGMLRDILSSAQLFHDPRVPEWIRYLDQIKQAFVRIWSGKQTPAQALAAVSGVHVN